MKGISGDWSNDHPGQDNELDHECIYDCDGGLCRICGKTVSDQLLENGDYMKKHMESNDLINVHKGLMPRRSHSFPVSRDWEDIDCRAIGCKYNRIEKCMVPSRCKISDDGRCTGFEPNAQQVQKVDGD